MKKEKLLEQKKNKAKTAEEFLKSLSPEKRKQLQQEMARIQEESAQISPLSLKILWYSTAPFIKRSEGIIAHYLLQGISYLGFPIIDVANYGLDSGGYLKFNKLFIFPVRKTKKDEMGFKTTLKHFEKFQIDILLYVSDIWKATDICKTLPDKVYSYSAIDMIDYPPGIVKSLKRFKGIISPSKFGEKELKKYGIDSTYIPPGINLQNYQPGIKLKTRKLFNIPKNDFVIGIVSSNRDKEKSNWDKMFEAIELFFKKNPKVRKKISIFIHAEPSDVDGGVDLRVLAKGFGIEKKIIWQDPHALMIGLPENFLGHEYQSFDVLLDLSSRKKFGLNILEAGGCGVPSIVTDFGVMRERTNYGKCGWLVKLSGLKTSSIMAKVAIPDPKDAAKALEEAYNNKRRRLKLGKKAAEYAKQFSWKLIIEQKWLPYLENLGEQIIMKPLKMKLKKTKKIEKIKNGKKNN